MGKKKIDKLIINSPYEEPKQYWHYDLLKKEFERKKGRRKAGYVVASNTNDENSMGYIKEIPLVNEIRKRVKDWRDSNYHGITSVTRKLLSHWNDPKQRENRFFFCQLEAIETLIWWTEASPAEKVGIHIPNDGGDFKRYCTKMATATGKTVDMAMLIAWQVLNKVEYPNNSNYTKNILIICPGITIKERLQVLRPQNKNNYYDLFNILPLEFKNNLNQCNIVVENWHTLQWDDEEKISKRRSVDKRGPLSDTVYVKSILKDMANASSLIVINDEGHHAWRKTSRTDMEGISREDIEEATVWIQGLDRINKKVKINACYDFTATPFVPSGKKTPEENLFSWIVSDFSLSDAIESGLVKTPRVVVGDEHTTPGEIKSKFSHIYKHVKSNLNKKANKEEPLPDLVVLAYTFLGKDWLEYKTNKKIWNLETPPVMITVANRTETAARIKYAFEKNKMHITELCEKEKILHIDSKVLAKVESGITKDISLRDKVNTVGKKGKTGEQIQNVISVGMLSEGWDAKTVTHIMGLRAFTSQLLCEQVVGRGLRRTSYEINEKTGLFEPEFVNVFGIPFAFLPHETYVKGKIVEEKPKIEIEVLEERKEYEIKWPNIIRINHEFKPELMLDMQKVNTLYLDAYKTPILVDLAPEIDGKPMLDRITTIQLDELAKKYRKQKIIFETARDVYEQLKPKWRGNREYMLGQVIKIVENFINSDKIQFTPRLIDVDELRKRLIITLNMTTIVHHIWQSIRFQNTEKMEPIFNTNLPIMSTSDMEIWYTKKKCIKTKRSHINRCVLDSIFEKDTAEELDKNPNVKAWVKNDHLGFKIEYIYKGEKHTYLPDFIIILTNGTILIIEVKGDEKNKDKTKKAFLNEWIETINNYGGFGKWNHVMLKDIYDLKVILREYNK